MRERSVCPRPRLFRTATTAYNPHHVDQPLHAKDPQLFQRLPELANEYSRPCAHIGSCSRLEGWTVDAGRASFG